MSSSTPLISRAAASSPLFWRVGALLVAGGIATGAFGAHGLKSRSVPADKIDSCMTASHYTIINGLGLLLLSQHPRFRFGPPAIALGTVLFSGSIHALVLNRDRFRFLGPVTPLGGLLMISGYVSLAL